MSSLTLTDFFEFDQQFCDGKTPENIEAEWRTNLEQRAENQKKSLQSNFSKMQSITTQWLVQMEIQEKVKDVTALQKQVEALQTLKRDMKAMIDQTHQQLDSQTKRRENLRRQLELYRITIANIPDQDPREDVLIQGGHLVCHRVEVNH